MSQEQVRYAVGLDSTVDKLMEIAREEGRAELRDRNAALEGICRSAGLCMSCLYGAPNPLGCTDCLGTGWDGGDPHSQIEVLEARVAKLEAALKPLHEYAASVWFDEARTTDEEIELMAIARAALKDTPQ
jgi:hypothetical protein